MSRLLCVLAAGLALAGPARAADPDAFGDPLPDGAKLRLGTARLRTFGGFHVLPPDYTTAVWYDGRNTVTVELATGKTLGKFGGRGGIVPLAVSPDGTRVAINALDAVEIRALDGTKLATVKPVLGSFATVAFSADGKRVAVSGLPDSRQRGKKLTATVWDVDADKSLAVVEIAQNGSGNVALAADGQTLATWGTHTPATFGDPAGPGLVVQVWDVATQKETATVRVEDQSPTAVAFAPDGRTLAVGSPAGVGLWDAKTGAAKVALLARKGIGQHLAFSPSGKTVAATGPSGHVQRWATADGRVLGVTPPPAGGTAPLVKGVAFPADDRAVAWGTTGTAVAVWEAPSGKRLTPAGGHTEAVRAVAFPADGNEILTAAGPTAIYRWDAATGKRLADLTFPAEPGFGSGPGFAATPVHLAADGSRVFAASGGVLDTALGVEVLNFAPSNYRTNAVRFPSADGTKLVVCRTTTGDKAAARTVTLIDAAAGRVLRTIELPAGQPGAEAAGVTPDGTKLVTAGTRQIDGKSELVVTGWDVKTAKPLGSAVLAGGFGTVAVVPAPDNTSAVVWTPAGTLVAVDLVAGTAGKPLTKPGAVTCPPAFDAAGKRLAFGTGGLGVAPGVRVVDPATGDTLHEFRGHDRRVTVVAFAPDGKTLVSGSDDTTAIVWDLTARKKPARD